MIKANFRKKKRRDAFIFSLTVSFTLSLVHACVAIHLSVHEWACVYSHICIQSLIEKAIKTWFWPQCIPHHIYIYIVFHDIESDSNDQSFKINSLLTWIMLQIWVKTSVWRENDSSWRSSVTSLANVSHWKSSGNNGKTSRFVSSYLLPSSRSRGEQGLRLESSLGSHTVPFQGGGGMHSLLNPGGSKFITRTWGFLSGIRIQES